MSLDKTARSSSNVSFKERGASIVANVKENQEDPKIEEVEENKLHVAHVFTLSIPVLMGYIPLGMAFGFLFAQAGGIWWFAPLMSILVFAGAAQFMVIPLLAANAPLASILVATAIINLRHIFYGLSILPLAPQNLGLRAYFIFALTDENYSLLTTSAKQIGEKERLALVALNHFWWVLGSFLGALLGAKLPSALQGLEFSLTALFAVLALEQWRAKRQFLPILLGFLSYLAAIFCAPKNPLMVAISATVLIASVYLTKKNKKENT